MTTKRIGEDFPITLSFTNDAGTAIDLTAVEGYGAILFYESDNTTIQLYSANAESGYNSTDVDLTDAATGDFKILFTRSLSELGRSDGKVMVQPLLQTTAAGYGSNQLRALGEAKECFTYESGIITTIPDIS